MFQKSDHKSLVLFLQRQIIPIVNLRDSSCPESHPTNISYSHCQFSLPLPPMLETETVLKLKPTTTCFISSDNYLQCEALQKVQTKGKQSPVSRRRTGCGQRSTPTSGHWVARHWGVSHCLIWAPKLGS